MPVVIRLISWADGRKLWSAGQYVKAVDVQLSPRLDWLIPTPLKKEACRFTSVRDALDTWREVLKKAPVRPDGKPNRPFTAFTVEFIRVSNERARD